MIYKRSIQIQFINPEVKPHNIINELTGVLVGLNRQDLLNNISRRFVASLRTSTTPMGQLMTDLGTLNDVSALADQTDPFAILLVNALQLNLKDAKKYHVVRRALRDRQGI